MTRLHYGTEQIRVRGQWWEVGCYVDGHAGQYLPERLADIADGVFGNVAPHTFTHELRTIRTRGEHGDVDAWEEHAEYVDELLSFLNSVTDGGAWDTEDGEVFLFTDLAWAMRGDGPSPWDEYDEDGTWTRARGLAYLTHDEDGNYSGHLGTPGCPYGSRCEDVAPVAWRVAYLVARETETPVDRGGLDHAMSLVVNDHDDVRHVIRQYGHRMYR